MTPEALQDLITDSWANAEKAARPAAVAAVARDFCDLSEEQIKRAVVAEGLEPTDRWPSMKALNARLKRIRLQQRQPAAADIEADDIDAIADAFEFWQQTEPAVRDRGESALIDPERWRRSLRTLKASGLTPQAAKALWARRRREQAEGPDRGAFARDREFERTAAVVEQQMAQHPVLYDPPGL